MFGGRIGNGSRYMSWIGLDELLTLVISAIGDESISGLLNAVSPNPTTNTDFTKIRKGFVTTYNGFYS